ncbi:hypothetical protein ACJX0J_019549, partial [Zea mays]
FNWFTFYFLLDCNHPGQAEDYMMSPWVWTLAFFMTIHLVFLLYINFYRLLKHHDYSLQEVNVSSEGAHHDDAQHFLVVFVVVPTGTSVRFLSNILHIVFTSNMLIIKKLFR